MAASHVVSTEEMKRNEYEMGKAREREREREKKRTVQKRDMINTVKFAKEI
jgi:hypothetical protein